MPRLEFTIAVKPFGEAAKKDAKKLTDELRTQSKEVDKDTVKLKQFANSWELIGKQIEKQKKRQAELFDLTKTKATELGQKLRELHTQSSAAFELGMFRGINRVQSGFEGVIRRVFSLKNALLATAVGGAGYLLGRKALGNAFGDIETEQTVRRRFGGDSSQLFSIADRIAGRAGVEGGTAQAGLIELAEAIQGTATTGAAFQGKKLTDTSSAALRKKLLDFAGSRYERLLTLFPNQDPAQLAELLAQVGTGAEGTRTFARAFGINKVLAGRIEKRAEKEKLGRGDVLDLLLESSGLTQEAAAQKRKTFQFQIKSIGAQLEDALGGVGRKAVESLNKKFGEGTTLAQKLQDFLASDRGKNAIDAMGQALSKMVGFAAELAAKIPEALGWLERNKTLLITLGSVYGGARVLGGGRDLVEGVLGKNIFSRGASSASPMYVSVTNPGFGTGTGGAPGVVGKGQKALNVLGALTGGVAAGIALDEALGISDFLSQTREGDIKGHDEREFAIDERKRKNRRFLRSLSGQVPQELRARYDQLTAEATGIDVPNERQTSAVAEITKMISDLKLQAPTVNVYVGGKQVAAVVEQEQIRRTKDQTPPRS